MAEKRNRERVNAEITLSLVMRLASEQGSPVTREQALAFLNREGLAYEMWKQMMHAGVNFITCSLLQHHVTTNDTTYLRLDQDRRM
jgi:hypothetical protein